MVSGLAKMTNPTGEGRPSAIKDAVPASTEPTLPPRSHSDWRGWIALLWAVGWGCAYAAMVYQAKAPQVLAWLRGK